MNNLEPRAKIGDVVIVKIKSGVQQRLVLAAYTKRRSWIYENANSLGMNEIFVMQAVIGSKTFTKPLKNVDITNKDILKNLTTNITYAE